MATDPRKILRSRWNEASDGDPEEIETLAIDLSDALRAVLDKHARSVAPVVGGGEHVCVACTFAVDGRVRHVLYPCPTVRAITEALEGETNGG